MKKKIIIAGWYGAGNIGDELLLKTILSWINQSIFEPIVISVSVKHTETNHHTKAIYGYDITALVEVMQNAACLIFGGGSLIQDYDRFIESDINDFFSPGCTYYLRLALLANQFAIPIIILGNGIGPLRSAASMKLASRFFDLAKSITLRDEESYHLFKKMDLINKSEVMIAPDIAFSLRDSNLTASIVLNEDISSVLHNYQKESFFIIGVNIREWQFNDNWQSLILSELLKIEQKNVFYMFLPFQDTDIDLCIKVSEQLKLAGKPCIVIKEINVDNVTTYYSFCCLIVNMRYHGVLLANLLKIPCITLEYDEKVRNLLIQLNEPKEHCFKIDELTGLANAIDNRLSNLNAENNVYSIIHNLQQKSLLHKEKLEDFLNSLQNNETNNQFNKTPNYAYLYLTQKIKNMEAQHLMIQQELVASKLKTSQLQEELKIAQLKITYIVNTLPRKITSLLRKIYSLLKRIK
ncbi:MAG: pyruvyl transferase [Gammaproteobacteria bacterium]|jgi:polysaccharide pyruvyl transferase CsaB|nr:pyruvyl transferase [Gammaproteobacteria bacterium]